MAHVHVPVGTIGLVIAKIGEPPPEDQLARYVECDHFQHSARFLVGGGQRGRQQEVLPSGSYDIDTGMFEVITIANAHQVVTEHLTMLDLHEVTIDRGEVGVVIAHVGAVPDSDSIGRVVTGHDSFQRPWEFLANGGQRGIQEEVLAGGRSYAINPWFAQVVRIPTRVLSLEWTRERWRKSDFSFNEIVLDMQDQIVRLNLRLAIQIPAASAPRLVSLVDWPSGTASWAQIRRYMEGQFALRVENYFSGVSAGYRIYEFEADFEVVLDQLVDEIYRLLGPLGIREIGRATLEQLDWDAPDVEIPRPVIHGMDPSRVEPLETPEENPISGGPGTTAVLTDTAEVSIYLSDAEAAQRVERAVEGFLALAGAQVAGRDDPVLGSWFRRLHAKVGGEVASSAAHAIDTRFVLAPDAAVAKDLMTGLAPVIGALGSVEQAVIRVGALLIVKADGRLSVCQLTAKQQLELDHNPSLATSPHEILGALQFGVNGSPRPIAELDQGRGEGVPGTGGEAEGGAGSVL